MKEEKEFRCNCGGKVTLSGGKDQYVCIKCGHTFHPEEMGLVRDLDGFWVDPEFEDTHFYDDEAL